MPDAILDRAGELDVVGRFLADLDRGPAALLLEGDVGAGKTTVWRAALEAARARGYTVLACHPAEAESTLAFAALGDLLQEVLPLSGDVLPEPQRRALEVAALVAVPGDLPPDQRSVSVAMLGLLRALALDAPVVVAVDDYQWLDTPSARVLEFVLRRLDTERVGLLASLRAGGPNGLSVLLGRDFGQRDAHRVQLSPLSAAALDQLFRARVGAGFSPPVLAQIAAASGGNPMFALEIARAVQRGQVRLAPGEPVPVPGGLQDLVRGRLLALPGPVLDVLVAAATASEPTVAVLERALPGRPVAALVDEAVRAGVLEVDGLRLRFAHPLFASTLYHSVNAERRRAMHRRLADFVSTPDERARHLSLAADGPDAGVAAALDEAARAAAARGAPDAAGVLSDRAVLLTPDGDHDGRFRRRVEAAEYHFRSGDTSRARTQLEEVVSELPPGPPRADVLRRLAKVRYRNDSCAVAAELLTRALAEVGPDVSLRAGIERDLAWAVTLCGDVPDAADHARTALRLLRGHPGDPMLAEVVAAATMADFLLGSGFDGPRLTDAVERERQGGEVPIEWRPNMVLAMLLKWSGDLDGARSRFEELHHRTTEAGDETSLPFLLAQMSEAATRAGDLAEARRHAERAHAIALQTGQELVRAQVLYARGLVEAHLGLVDEARATATAGLALSESTGSVLGMILNQAVLGFIELSREDPAAAHRHLGPLVAWRDVVGIREPGVLPFMPDEIEALVALGHLGHADALLATYEADAARLSRPSALLAAARCRALYDAASGDVDGAAARLAAAIDEHADATQPFDRARTVLALGTIQRRTRRRRVARTSVEAALEVFERLGATLWSARAHGLLGRPESRLRDALSALTPGERRVAELVASGRTNQEVADQLFVTVRAVEVHLTNTYRKLGIRSRTQLTARLAGTTADPPRGRDA